MRIHQLFPCGGHGRQVVRRRVGLDVLGHRLLVPRYVLRDQGLRFLQRGLDLEDQGILLGVAVRGQNLDVVFLVGGEEPFGQNNPRGQKVSDSLFLVLVQVFNLK